MRRLSTLLLCVLLTTALVGCSADDDIDLGSVEDVAGVADVEQVPFTDDPESEFLRVTLDDGLSEADVRSAVDDVKDYLDQQDRTDVGSLQIVFDDVSAGVYPGRTSIENPDPDLERALWLREDGRATWFGPGPQFRPGDALTRSGTRPLAIAPTPDVAQLALDLQAAVSSENEVRRSYLVGSPDGDMRVQWSNYPGGLDRETLEAFVALQERLPGTTGWYDDSRPGAGVHFDVDDIALDDLLERGPQLVAELPVVQVGWGPFRAETFSQLRQATTRLRRELPRLIAIDGLRAITEYGDAQVDDLATFDAVRRILPDTEIALVREPSDLIGFDPEPVFEAGFHTSDAELRVLRGLAEVDGVRAVRGDYLVLERSIADDDLLRALTLVRPWTRQGSVTVQTGEAPIYRLSEATPSLGLLAPSGFTPANPLLPPARESDVERVAAAWYDVR